MLMRFFKQLLLKPHLVAKEMVLSFSQSAETVLPLLPDRSEMTVLLH